MSRWEGPVVRSMARCRKLFHFSGTRARGRQRARATRAVVARRFREEEDTVSPKLFTKLGLAVLVVSAFSLSRASAWTCTGTLTLASSDDGIGPGQTCGGDCTNTHASDDSVGVSRKPSRAEFPTSGKHGDSRTLRRARSR